MRQRGPDKAHGLVTRRGLVMGGLQLGFVGALGARMHFLQVDQAEEFRMLAEDNRINIHLIPPARGRIFDRNGVSLAQNRPSYRITLTREHVRDVDEALDRLGQLIPLDPVTIRRARAEMSRTAPFFPVTVAENVTWEEVSRVALNAPALPGITPEVGLTRVYPEGSNFAHVVGYVGRVSERDLARIEDPDPVLKLPHFQIGKIGVEAKHETMLRGSAGSKQVEVNAAGRVMRELERREGQAGADLQLTIDAQLQNYVQARLSKEAASAVVIDVETGDVVAIASSPTYDPNLFVRGISHKDYNALTGNQYRPLASKSVQGLYPPGSTFKMITALAALEAGVIGPNDTHYCPGHLTVSGRRFHCWRRGGHGSVNLKNSLKSSCDVYYYNIALKVGIDRISEMARKFGLGVAHDLPMSAVAEGIAPTKEWAKRVYDKTWRIGDTVNASIGQGNVLASPMQLAVMTARLATGRSVTPRLVRSVNGVPEPSGAGEDIDVNPRNLEEIRRAMNAVSNEAGGTAYRSRILSADMQMAGKTGTSQVRNITAAERRAGVIRNEDLPWERRDHALFVDFAPYDKPKYAVAVIVEHGGGGSAVAAPVARDITLQALYGGEPPLDAYPPGQRDLIAEQQRDLRRYRPIADTKGNDRA